MADKALNMVYKQREKILAVFREFDEDKQETVSDEEFAMALGLLGMDISVPAINEVCGALSWLVHCDDCDVDCHCNLHSFT